ncbi:MAG: dATP pyrophosphohydrolase [Rhodospirillaceae bacterium]|nr:dATP pyrophosphohydrolase [Rhodospirillaceae bacterium]
MNFNVKPVQTGADWKAFYEAPHVAQGHDPFWIAPLHFMVGEQLNPKKNPWFKHGEAAFWVAMRDGKPIGRISAQIDRSHLELRKDDTGFFGFFETIDDQAVTDALFDAAAAWLRQRGMKRVLGPFSLNINEESGLLIDGFNSSPRMMMGHAQPYYAKRVEAVGFAKAVDMYAYLTPMDTALPFQYIAWLQRAMDRNPRLKVRALDTKRIDEEIATVVRIFNAAWAENWNFIPLTDADLKHLASELKPLLVPELVSFGTIDGEPMAMCVALPDLNQMIADLDGRLLPFGWAKLGWRILTKKNFSSGTRVPFMGVMPQYKNKPMGSVLALLTVGAVRSASLKLRMPVTEMSWVLESNHQTRHSIESIGGRVYKTYRMYEKPL